ncbi:hypothetical protein TWF481_004609 [Arthrobotrys musiformis]|uniref:Uncharacterized protein n=1 Tax=Arthrobotrys musiformis TaxID=47236 RepID=A0AAV9WM50_9PEZI
MNSYSRPPPPENRVSICTAIKDAICLIYCGKRKPSEEWEKTEGGGVERKVLNAYSLISSEEQTRAPEGDKLPVFTRLKDWTEHQRKEAERRQEKSVQNSYGLPYGSEPVLVSYLDHTKSDRPVPTNPPISLWREALGIGSDKKLDTSGSGNINWGNYSGTVRMDYIPDFGGAGIAAGKSAPLYTPTLPNHSMNLSSPNIPTNFSSPSLPANFGGYSPSLLANFSSPSLPTSFSKPSPSINYGRPSLPINSGKPSPPINYGKPSPPTNYGKPSPPINYGKPRPSINYREPRPSLNYSQPTLPTNYGKQILPAKSNPSIEPAKPIMRLTNKSSADLGATSTSVTLWSKSAANAGNYGYDAAPEENDSISLKEQANLKKKHHHHSRRHGKHCRHHKSHKSSKDEAAQGVAVPAPSPLQVEVESVVERKHHKRCKKHRHRHRCHRHKLGKEEVMVFDPNTIPEAVWGGGYYGEPVV